MPFANVERINSTFDDNFKNLRGRKVQCQFFDEQSAGSSTSSTRNGAHNSKFVTLDKRSHRKKSLAKRRSRSSNQQLMKRRSPSVNSLDKSYPHSASDVDQPSDKKIFPNKASKALSPGLSPERARRSRSRSVCSLDNCCGSPGILARTAGKKNLTHFWDGYGLLVSKTREKNATSRSRAKLESQFTDDSSHVPSDTPKKRVYRKKTSKLSWNGEGALVKVPTDEDSKFESINDLGSRNINDSNGSSTSTFKPSKRTYRKKKHLLNSASDNALTTEPTTSSRRKSRSLCTLNCCSLFPPKKRTYKRRSLYGEKPTPFSADTNQKLSTSPMIYQCEDFVPSSQVVVEFKKKRTYCRKGFEDTISTRPKKKPKISLLNFDDLKLPSATVVVDMNKKKTFRKKYERSSSPGSSQWSTAKLISPDTVDDNAVSTPIQIQLKNEELLGCDAADAEAEGGNSLSQSTTSDYVVQHQKRGRGRPRKNCTPVAMAYRLASSDDELTWTCSSSLSQDSQRQQEVQRARSRRAPWQEDQQPPQEVEEEVSEYELLRRRNIEENMKMLRQIFMDQGLELGPGEEDKSCDTPKARKSYSRLPPPPPRPKSARIEVKRSEGFLDFSKFCHKLSAA